jgi:hypothetical protein
MTGADVSDWFNYGFDEASWNEYANRQKMMREIAKRQPQMPGRYWCMVHGVVWCGVVWCGVVWCGAGFFLSTMPSELRT